MIKSRQEYLSVCSSEAEYYCGAYTGKKEKLLLHIKHNIDVHYVWNFLRHLRKAEYYANCKGRSLLGRVLYLHHERQKNRLGAILNFSIADNVLGEGAVLYHPGVIINPNAKIGRNCLFHGNNCIGNKGTATVNNGSPIIGNGVEFGFGAVVIGNIEIADRIKIGANAVVTQSFLEEGITIAGNPARKLEKREARG